MAVDFRPPEEGNTGLGPHGSFQPLSPAEQLGLTARRLVYGVLVAAALFMILAGVAIWLTEPRFLAPESRPLVALALVIAGVCDGVMAWAYGRWSRQRRF